MINRKIKPLLLERLVKSPKVYWRDSGLLHALMNVPDDSSLLSQPWVGASWEGYAIEQILGVLSAQRKNSTLIISGPAINRNLISYWILVWNYGQLRLS